MTQSSRVLMAATQPERQAVLDAYLTWLSNPETQSRQIRDHLYDSEGGCCALGGLGEVLAEQGFAQRRGEDLTVFTEGGPTRPTGLPVEVMVAVGLGAVAGLEAAYRHIVALNDSEGQTFAQIGQQLGELGLVAPP